MIIIDSSILEFRVGLMIRILTRKFAISLALATTSACFSATTASAMQALPTNGVLLPVAKPDIAQFYDAIPVEIEIPVVKPDIESILPRSTRTLAEMIRSESGVETLSEATYKLKSGEGLGILLRRAGYEAADIAASINAVQGRASLRALPVGLDVRVADQGFAFTLRDGRDVYAINDPQEGWYAFTAIRPIERYLAYAQGVIDDSIYRAAAAADIPDDALSEYVRVMGFSVDFQREIRSGDAFDLMYEQQIDMITGKKISTKLHYAGLMLSGTQLGYYRFDHSETRVGWYDRDGASAARTLIRTPISGARLSSSYGMRKHPISGYNAMHKGVDFAAPTGTPIVAAGSGVVTKSGWLGSYGRYIRIRHNGTYDTAYAHMSKIARGVTRGARVEQGQIIGYVGSTGRSTGPHLHYEILVNNRKVNPMTVSLPTGERIPPELLEDFKAQVDMVEAEVLATGSVRFAAMDLLPSELDLN